MEGVRSVEEAACARHGADNSPLAPDPAAEKRRKLDAGCSKLTRNLEFEQAARLRDQFQKMRQETFGVPDQRAR
jgi:hypothetical protein